MADVITIDGPGASGKGTLALKLAQKTKWHLLPSGNIYRALAFASLQKGLDEKNISLIIKLIPDLSLSFTIKNGNLFTYLDSICINKHINNDNISNLASHIATSPQIRQELMPYQRSFCNKPGLVAEGRDMGTVIFPNAKIKIYLNASLEARARRRLKQWQQSGEQHPTIAKTMASIRERDERDSNRAISPLHQAKDAIILDATNTTAEQVFEKTIKIVKERINIL